MGRRLFDRIADRTGVQSDRAESGSPTGRQQCHVEVALRLTPVPIGSEEGAGPVAGVISSRAGIKPPASDAEASLVVDASEADGHVRFLAPSRCLSGLPSQSPSFMYEGDFQSPVSR